MYNDGLFSSLDSDFYDNLQRVEQMLKFNKSQYFDVDDFVQVVNYLIGKNIGKAQKVIEIGLKQHPNSMELYLKKSIVLILNGKYSSSESILKKIVKIEPLNYYAYLYYSLIAVTRNNKADALKYVEKTLVLNNNNNDENIDILYSFAELLMSTDKYRYALFYLQFVLKINKKYDDVYFDISDCYVGLNDIENAIKFLKKHIDNKPYDEFAWSSLGQLYEDLSQYKMAVDAYEFALAIVPSSVGYKVVLGRMNYNLGNYQIAIDYLEDIVGNVDVIIGAEVNLLLGQCYQELKINDNAIFHYEKIFQYDSESSEAWYGISEINYFEENFDTAIFYIRKAISLDPLNDTYWNRFGIILRETNQINYAIKAFNIVIDLDEGNYDAYLNLNECYFELKEFEKLSGIAKKSIEIFNLAEFYFFFALANFEMGNYKVALEFLEKGIIYDMAEFQNFIDFYPKVLVFDNVKELINRLRH